MSRQRRASASIFSSGSRSAWSFGSASRSSCALPRMPVSGLLISWATPAPSWPMAASFCVSASCACASRSSRVRRSTSRWRSSFQRSSRARAELADGGELLRLGELRVRLAQLARPEIDLALEVLVPALEPRPRPAELLGHRVERRRRARELVAPLDVQPDGEVACAERPRRRVEAREPGGGPARDEERKREDGDDEQRGARHGDPAHGEDRRVRHASGRADEHAEAGASADGRPGEDGALVIEGARPARPEPREDRGPRRVGEGRRRSRGDQRARPREPRAAPLRRGAVEPRHEPPADLRVGDERLRVPRGVRVGEVGGDPPRGRLRAREVLRARPRGHLARGPGEDRERDPGDGRERRGEEEQRELAAQRHATAAPPPTAPSPPAPSS